MSAARTLICGSLAFDTIMVFPDRFARHILPEQTHVLSVSFQIRLRFGIPIQIDCPSLSGHTLVWVDDGLPTG